MRTRIDFRLRRVESQGTWFTCVLLAVLLAVEILGRQGSSDLHDGVAVALLITLVVAGYVLIGKRALSWSRPMRGVLELLLARLRARKFEIGIDLRRSPPVPSATPALIRDVGIVLSALAALLIILTALGGIDFRAISTRVLYVGHLAAMFALWTALLFAIATSILLPAACIHDAFACRHIGPGPRARRREYVFVGGYFAIVLIAGLTLPIWVPSALCAIALCVFIATMWRSSTPSVTLLWRGHGAREVRAMEWRVYETACASIIALAFLDLVLLSLGGAAIGLRDLDLQAMPVTTTLGSLTAWLGGAALSSGALFATGWIATQRKRNPARPCPTTIHVSGAVTDRRAITGIFSSMGWRTRFTPAKPEADDVAIEMVDSPMPPLGRGRRRWPLVVSLKGLEVPELQHILQRRDEIQRRRVLMRGIEKLLKLAARREFARGQGFWIAPHYWYVSGMTRDVDEDQCDLADGTVISGVIGPSYHRVLPRSARQHLHTVFRALEVDLLFLEDGVGYRGLRRVLRLLFEHFDVHGGRQRIEERHLQGIVGLRAILHEYELGHPLRKRAYPEPDYETLGRARILHVFKDRGEHEEPVEDPVEGQDVPVPALSR